jgi:hypothetical protein
MQQKLTPLHLASSAELRGLIHYQMVAARIVVENERYSGLLRSLRTCFYEALEQGCIPALQDEVEILHTMLAPVVPLAAHADTLSRRLRGPFDRFRKAFATSGNDVSPWFGFSFANVLSNENKTGLCCELEAVLVSLPAFLEQWCDSMSMLCDVLLRSGKVRDTSSLHPKASIQDKRSASFWNVQATRRIWEALELRAEFQNLRVHEILCTAWQRLYACKEQFRALVASLLLEPLQRSEAVCDGFTREDICLANLHEFVASHAESVQRFWLARSQARDCAWSRSFCEELCLLVTLYSSCVRRFSQTTQGEHVSPFSRETEWISSIAATRAFIVLASCTAGSKDEVLEMKRSPEAEAELSRLLGLNFLCSSLVPLLLARTTADVSSWRSGGKEVRIVRERCEILLERSSLVLLNGADGAESITVLQLTAVCSAKTGTKEAKDGLCITHQHGTVLLQPPLHIVHRLPSRSRSFEIFVTVMQMQLSLLR